MNDVGRNLADRRRGSLRETSLGSARHLTKVAISRIWGAFVMFTLHTRDRRTFDGISLPKRRARSGGPTHADPDRGRGHAWPLPGGPRPDGRRHGATPHRH